MTVKEILSEVITLPEAVDIAAQMGYKLDRSNLLRSAQVGRLAARKSVGTWLTTRTAVQKLVIDLATEDRGRPRPVVPIWADVQMTPELAGVLEEIDQLRQQIAATPRQPEEEDRLRQELTIEAIYHTSHLAGNSLSLPEVRTIVEACMEKTSTKPIATDGLA